MDFDPVHPHLLHRVCAQLCWRHYALGGEPWTPLCGTAVLVRRLLPNLHVLHHRCIQTSGQESRRKVEEGTLCVRDCCLRPDGRLSSPHILRRQELRLPLSHV